MGGPSSALRPAARPVGGGRPSRGAPRHQRRLNTARRCSACQSPGEHNGRTGRRRGLARAHNGATAFVPAPLNEVKQR